MVLSAKLLGALPVGAQLDGLALRLGGSGAAGQWPAAKTTYQGFTVTLGRAARKPDAMVRDFDRNVVAASRRVVRRAAPWALSPGDFRAGAGEWTWVRFDVAFAYTAGDLVLEIAHDGPTKAIKPIPLDASPAGANAAAAYAAGRDAATSQGQANKPVLSVQLSYRK